MIDIFSANDEFDSSFAVNEVGIFSLIFALDHSTLSLTKWE